MQTLFLSVSGLAAGFYASLAAVGYPKTGTITLASGTRHGVLMNAATMYTVVAITDRNTAGAPMQVRLQLFAGSPPDTAGRPVDED